MKPMVCVGNLPKTNPWEPNKQLIPPQTKSKQGIFKKIKLRILAIKGFAAFDEEKPKFFSKK
jgi:hypothetical protein